MLRPTQPAAARRSPPQPLPGPTPPNHRRRRRSCPRRRPAAPAAGIAWKLLVLAQPDSQVFFLSSLSRAATARLAAATRTAARSAAVAVSVALEFICRVCCLASSSPGVQAACAGRILLSIHAPWCEWQALKCASSRDIPIFVPIGIAIILLRRQLSYLSNPAARGWCPSQGAVARADCA